MTSEKKCHIPKIIHQMWKDENVPAQWAESPKEWIRLFPDWEYKFWTDKTMREFMVQHYPDFVETYDNYPYPIQRADSFRCYILHYYGGIYSDLDIVATSNFQFLFEDTDAEVYLPKTDNIESYTNCIMASKSGAKFWEHTFEVLKKRAKINYKISYVRIIYSAGPQALTFSVNTYPNPICVLPRCIISQNLTNPEIKDNRFTRALVGGSWHRWDAVVVTTVYTNRKSLYILFLASLIYWIYLFFLYRNYYLKCD